MRFCSTKTPRFCSTNLSDSEKLGKFGIWALSLKSQQIFRRGAEAGFQPKTIMLVECTYGKQEDKKRGNVQESLYWLGVADFSLTLALTFLFPWIYCDQYSKAGYFYSFLLW